MNYVCVRCCAIVAYAESVIIILFAYSSTPLSLIILYYAHVACDRYETKFGLPVFVFKFSPLSEICVESL